MTDTPLGPVASSSTDTPPAPAPTSTTSTSFPSISLSRATARRTPSGSSPAADPLSQPSPPTTYPVWTSHKRRTSQGSTTASVPAPSSVDPSNSLTPTAPTPSASPLPPTSPTSPPPLISRPSNNSLPVGTPAGRPYARSVSEARQALLGQNLKAQLQALGLSAESAGNGMAQVLAGVGSGGDEWKNVKKAVETGKVTLLTPKEVVPGMLTPAFIADHLVLLEERVDAGGNDEEKEKGGVANEPRGFVSLTGLRGLIIGSELVVLSCGTALTETSEGLLKPGSLSPADFADETVHRALRGEAYPLPPPSLPPPHPYPAFAIESQPTTLDIPRASRSASGAAAASKASTSSRLAALFSKPLYEDPLSTPAATTSQPSPANPAPASSAPADPTPSVSPTRPGNLQVPVLVISKAIRHAEAVRLVGRALDAHLRVSLNRIPGCEDALLERIAHFALRMQPPPTWKGVVPPAAPALGDSLFAASVDEVSDQYQDLLHLARGEVEKGLTGAGLPTAEAVVDSSVEQIEELLTTQLYDRWFAPASSGDVAEDEALVARAGALREELTLSHLGLDFGAMGEDEHQIREALDDIVAEAGRKLDGLNGASARSPRGKLDCFVELHKVIVDGLSRLPAIPLKKETSSSQSSVHEMEMSPASTRPPSVSITIPETAEAGSADDDLLRTPRPAPSTRTSDEPLPSPVSLTDTNSPEPTMASPRSSRAPSPTKKSTSSSADLILPLLIYSLVQHCPSHLASDLKFVHRFRAQDVFRGEGAYCATGVSAAVEFLVHADALELGLPAGSLPASSASSMVGVGAPSVGKRRLRGSNVTQELDQLVDSANHALVGLADGGFKLLFGARGVAPRTIEEVKNVLDGAGNVARSARGGLLRRATNASFTGSGTLSPGADDGLSPTVSRGSDASSAQREMVDFVPKPEAEGGPRDLYAQPEAPAPGQEEDARSVRSFGSRLREPLVGRSRTGSESEEGGKGGGERSIGDRLGEKFSTSFSGLGRFGSVGSEGGRAPGSSAGSRPSSIFAAFGTRAPTPGGGGAATPNSITPRRPTSIASSDFAALSLAEIEPNQRFMGCDAGDLRLGEVAELLEEYRRLASALVSVKQAQAAGVGLGV